MFEKLDIFRMSADMAAHAGRRQALAAQNMANVDTPGYRAQRMASFAEIAESGDQGTALRATRAGHLSGGGTELAQARITEDLSDPAPDGNTVSAEGEMLASVAAKREHDRALAIYTSALNVLHTTLKR